VSVARERVKARLEAAVAAGGRIVDESHTPSHWTLADRAGNRVCICAWPDGGHPVTVRRRRIADHPLVCGALTVARWGTPRLLDGAPYSRPSLGLRRPYSSP
jgi:hypothetical protein